MVAAPPPHPEQPTSQSADPRLGRVVLDEPTLQARVKELAAQITLDYAGRPPILIGILKGAFMFVADLARAIDLPLDIDFLAVSSYGATTKSSGVVRMVKDIDVDVTGRHVILVEDIVDTGATLRYLRKHFAQRGAASVEFCTLLQKEDPAGAMPQLRYVGFAVPAEFLVGYGLDAGERFRNLPYIVVLNPE